MTKNYEFIFFSFLVGIFIIYVFCFLYKAYKKKKKRKYYINSGIDLVDKMKGIEFENFLLAHFEQLKYKGTTTKASSDFGADLILKKESEIIVVQAKRYNSKVSLHAVQEIVASMGYYKAKKGIVVTNNYYTKSAKSLAEANKIELWDRDTLITMMNKHKSKNKANEILQATEVEKICPICGNSLLIKNGKFGSFLGCSNYPKCKFTR